MIKIKKIHILGIITAVITIIADLIFLRHEKIFYFVLGVAFIIGLLPFFVSLFIETEKEKEKEEMFLEFSRNLVESVRAGTPISRSILNVRGKDYGSLTPHINKLANQISLGIPVKKALNTFASDVNSNTISRAITLISEAEQAGGEIENILESVARSVSQTEKLKKERKAAIYNLVVQGYIIFLIFIVIMLIMEFKILPMTSSLGSLGGGGDLGGLGIGFSMGGKGLTPEEMARGKLAEGSIRNGIKHSFILVFVAWLISTGARAFLS